MSTRSRFRAKHLHALPIAAALGIACNAILGIDGNVKDPIAEEGGAPSPQDDSGLDSSLAPTLSVTPSSVVIRQGETLEVTVRVSSAVTGRAYPVSTFGLPKGLSATDVVVQETTGVAKLVLTASAFAVLGPTSIGLRVTDNVAVTTTLPIEVKGNFDPAFGVDGMLRLNLQSNFHEVGLWVQDDDKILVAFSDTTTTGNAIPYLTRRTPEGALDPAFGNAGIVSGGMFSPNYERLHAVMINSAGSILAFGQVGSGGSSTSLWYVLGPNGERLSRSTFDAYSTTADWVTVAASNPSTGGAYVVFARDISNSPKDGALGRLLADGGLDPSFVADGGAFLFETKFGNAPYPNALVVTGGGSAAIAMDRKSNNAESGALIRRLPDAGPDPSFNDGGFVYVNDPLAGHSSALIVDPGSSGSYLVAGDSIIATLARASVHRFSSIGARDATFGDGGLALILPQAQAPLGSNAWSLSANPDNKTTLVGGGVVTTSGIALFVARMLADGAVDKTFGIDGSQSFLIGARAEARRLFRQKNGGTIAAVLVQSAVGQPFDVVLIRILP